MKNCRHFVEGVQEMIENETKWTVSAPTDEDSNVVLDFLKDRGYPHLPKIIARKSLRKTSIGYAPTEALI